MHHAHTSRGERKGKQMNFIASWSTSPSDATTASPFAGSPAVAPTVVPEPISNIQQPQQRAAGGNDNDDAGKRDTSAHTLKPKAVSTPVDYPRMLTTKYGEPAPVLHVKLLSETARLPNRQTTGSIGYDLCAAHGMVVPPGGGRGLCQTDLQIGIPPGHYGRIAPRSGLALKQGIMIGAGVIDPDYTGNVGIVIFNMGDKEFKIYPGDRVAQLILEKATVCPIVTGSTASTTWQRWGGGAGRGADNIWDQGHGTSRGTRGFGSSGQRG